MLVFIRSQWFDVRELPAPTGTGGMLQFKYAIPESIELYFSLWESESSRDPAMATKILPFTGHCSGIYEGCTMASYYPDGPPHSMLIKFTNRIVQKTKPE